MSERWYSVLKRSFAHKTAWKTKSTIQKIWEILRALPMYLWLRLNRHEYVNMVYRLYHGK